jgi:hypothetical protein
MGTPCPATDLGVWRPLCSAHVVLHATTGTRSHGNAKPWAPPATSANLPPGSTLPVRFKIRPKMPTTGEHDA